MKIKDGGDVINLYKTSPFPFIEDMFGLRPLKHGEVFEKGKHIAPNQFELLHAIELALAGIESPKISVRSGRGCGKTTALAWIILWFLFTFYDAQVPCTAPTPGQLHDALWKEISIWINKMPKQIANLYEYSQNYVRIKERPDSWFARAKTARKESPEALSGVHSDHVLAIIDEASGVADEIFKDAEGVFTGKNVFIIMCSNPRRLTGYFYNSHFKNRDRWQCLHFNGENSPLVDKQFIQLKIDQYGKDSDEYAVDVRGDFPRADAVDDKGFVPLLLENDLRFTDYDEFIGKVKLGVDVAGEGSNKTVWVVRDNFKAKIIATEEISNAKSVAQKTLSIMALYNIEDKNVYVDSFGVGADVLQQLGLAGCDVNGINVGNDAEDKEKFLNLRAEAYFRVKDWLRSGGELVRNDKWKELLTVRFRPTLRGKVQIMSKDLMRNEGIQSPDIADSLMLTFTEEDFIDIMQPTLLSDSFDKYNPI